jgi:hypothetical protein
VDEDGRLPHWAAGFLGGAAIGGGLELAKQLYNNRGNVLAVDIQKVGAKALSGAVVGTTAAVTFRGSLLLQAGAVGIASTAGGVADRAIDGDAATKPTDSKAMALDLAAGVAGGAAGGALAAKYKTTSRRRPRKRWKRGLQSHDSER